MAIVSASNTNKNNDNNDKNSQFIMASICVFIATLTAMIDTGIANIALPTLAKEFTTNEATVIWVVTAYLLAMVACTLPMASLGEVYGYRRVFIFGLVVFTLASLVCGLAWSLPTLIYARVFQGVGASCILSTNLALIRYIFPPTRLGLGLGINAICVGLGFSLGAGLTSLILEIATWHWLFLINLPIGLVCLVLAVKYLPITPPNTYKYDFFAALLCASGFSSLVFAIGQLTHQQAMTAIYPTFIICGLSFIGLIFRQRGHKAPFLALDLFQYKVFTLSILSVLFVFIAQGLAFVAMPFSIHSLLGRDQFEISFLMIPWPITAALMSIVTGRLIDRYQPAILVCFGMIISAIAMFCLTTLSKDSASWLIVTYMALCGAGIAFFNAPNQFLVMTATPKTRSGAAGAFMGLSRLLGQSIGSALVAFLLISYTSLGSKYALYLGVFCYLTAFLLSGARIFLKNNKD